MLPLNTCKAERGYALAQDALDTPLRAQPPVLTSDLSLSEAAGRVLREMFCQFTTNLSALRSSDDPEVVHQARVAWRRWARGRILRLHEQFQRALKDTGNPDRQHRARIFAKRMRYGIEALQPLLPQKRTQRWYQQATRLQTSIGATRDVMQAGALVAKLEVDRGLVEFLHGVAVGQARSG